MQRPRRQRLAAPRERARDDERLVELAQVRALMAEIIAVATSLGIGFPADLAEQKIENTRSMGAYRTSMQIDRQERRPLEVESILGRPLEIARQNRVATPYLEALYRMAARV